jgi:hypothetical protein
MTSWVEMRREKERGRRRWGNLRGCDEVMEEEEGSRLFGE